MIDRIILRNIVCAYFHNNDLPILSALRLVPVDQILDIAENFDSYPFLKLNEVLVRIIFKDIEPTPLFSFREEMKKVKSLVKLVSFKKLIFKKMMTGRVHALKKIKKLRDIAEKVKKKLAMKASKIENNLESQPEGMINENRTEPSDQNQNNQNTNPPMSQIQTFMKNNSHLLVFFIDKAFILVLREISNMKSNLDVYKNIIKMISDETLEKMVMAFLNALHGKQPTALKIIGNNLVDPGNKDRNQIKDFVNFLKISQEFGGSQAHSTSDFSFGMDMMSEKSSSLFNFNL